MYFDQWTGALYAVPVVSIDLFGSQIVRFLTMEYIGSNIVLSICDIDYSQIFSLQCPVPSIQIRTHTSPGDGQPSTGLPASRWRTVKRLVHVPSSFILYVVRFFFFFPVCDGKDGIFLKPKRWLRSVNSMQSTHSLVKIHNNLGHLTGGEEGIGLFNCHLLT